MLVTEADEKLVNILREIDDKPVEPIKIKYAQYLFSIKPIDLALAEQELFNNGVPIKIIEDNLLEHIKLLVNPMEETIDSLPEAHIIKKLIAEHRQIDYLLDEILILIEQLKKISNLSSSSPEFLNLLHISTHLNASSRHADMEEKTIFPLFSQAGLEIIIQILREEYLELINYDTQFVDLSFLAYSDLTNIIQRFQEISVKLIPLKKKNSLIKERLLYPIARDIITDEEVWDKLKKDCEGIGFCCFIS